MRFGSSKLGLTSEEEKKILKLRMLEQIPEKSRTAKQVGSIYELSLWLSEESPKILQRLSAEFHTLCDTLLVDGDSLENWERNAHKFTVPEIPDRLTDTMFQKLEAKMSIMTSTAYNSYEEASEVYSKMLAYRNRFKLLCKAVIGNQQKSEWYAESVIEAVTGFGTMRMITDVQAMVSRYDLILRKLDAAQKILSRRVTAMLSQMELDRSFGGRKARHVDDQEVDDSNIHELDDDDIEDATADDVVKDDLGRRRNKRNGKER